MQQQDDSSQDETSDEEDNKSKAHGETVDARVGFYGILLARVRRQET